MIAHGFSFLDQGLVEIQMNAQALKAADIPTHVKRLQELFVQAENQAKRAEYEYGEGPIIPAINELRYAGSHLVGYLAAEDDATRLQELDKAIRHCQRAIYDATEARLMVLYHEFQEFRHTYRNVSLLPHVSNYEEILRVSFEVTKAVGSRKSDVSKDDHYMYLQELHEKFEPYVQQLSIIDVELRKELKSQGFDRKMAWAGAVGLAIGLLVAVGAWLSPREPNHASDAHQVASGSVEAKQGAKCTGVPRCP